MSSESAVAASAASRRAEIETRLEISPDDLSYVRRFGKVAAQHLSEYVDHFYGWLSRQPEFGEFFHEPARLERVKQMQMAHWAELFRDPFGKRHEESCARIAEVHVRIGLSLPAYMTAVDVSLQFFLGLSEADAGQDEMNRMHRAVTKLIHADTTLVVDTFTRMTQETIATQTRAMLEMSTPVATLWDTILLLPIYGLVDTTRAQDIMNASLRKIADSRARVFILDISGVSVVDTAVANHIINITRATRLMGCQTILSGVSPGIAQTIVSLGIEVGSLRTKSTLRDALEEAFESAGLQVIAVARR